jgi:hypothetical protein
MLLKEKNDKSGSSTSVGGIRQRANGTAVDSDYRISPSPKKG